VLGLVRQCSYSFLEYLEESAITAIKIVIKVSTWNIFCWRGVLTSAQYFIEVERENNFSILNL
jgi:hypothetical protein